MSDFWSGWIIVLTVVNIVACFWIIWWTQRPRADDTAAGESTGHYWDGDLTEYNNPMPRWWLWMFYITLFFGIAYLVLFPGMGHFKGTLGWTQTSQYENEVEAADEKFGPLFAQFSNTDIPALAKNPEAVEIGRGLFLNYCSTCHGSDAKGARGFPDLTDNDWLYGGTPDAIKTSIANGRSGVMPSFDAVLGERGVKEMAEYVLSLSGRSKYPDMVREGQKKFAMCMGCHGADGTGNQALGAPNLTDDVWLYGSFPISVQSVIRNGRNGQMPPHKNFLGDDKVHLLSTYIYSLSND
ncbi:MAG: cytochrome-c oxidase, cbb3-type subunit III [Pseudomonadota bacterium]